MSEKVFVYRRTGAGNDVFEGVCSPSQLALLPEDAPDEDYDPDPTRFTLAEYSGIFTSSDDLDGAWNDIYDAVTGLVHSMNLLDQFEEEDNFRIGVSSASHTTSVYISV